MTPSDTEPSAVSQPDSLNFDVIVVGASLAGCTAAHLYAQQGLRVALVEQQREAGAFKHPCTDRAADVLGSGQGQAYGASPAGVWCAVEQSGAIPLAASLAARDLGEPTPLGRQGCEP